MRIDEEDKKIFRLLLQEPKKRKDLLKEISSEKVLERRLAKEKKYGLIHSPRWGWYELTKEGKEIAEQMLATTIISKLTHPKLRKLINMLPLEQYRAFFRLVLDAVIGKTHLLSYFDRGWPTPIVFGPTQSLKTTLAEIICYLLGLNPNKNIYLVPTAAPRELGLRHERKSGGFKAIPSSYFNEIFVTLDECNDPPSQGVKNSIFFFLDDRREFPVEDKLVTKKCCALLIFNMEEGLGGLRAFGIKDSHIRRSIPLDTSSLRGRLNKPTSIARKLKKYLFSPSGPRLDIYALRPRITKLPDKYCSLLEKLLFSCVEKDSLVSSYPLEILTLSRLMLVEPNVPVEDVLRSVVYDFLLCIETLGITERGWKEKFSQLTTKEEKEDQERISELPEIEQEKEPTQALPATEEARMEEETKKVQDKLRITTEFWPQYKKLMDWVEAWIDEIQSVENDEIWQFFSPEEKDEILIILDAFKVVKEHFGKIEERNWGGLKAFKSAVSDLDKRYFLPLREICGKASERQTKYKQLMTLLETRINQLESLQNGKLWQFLLPEEKEKLIVIFDIFKSIKGDFAKMKEGGWVNLEKCEDIFSDREKRYDSLSKEIGGKVLEREMIKMFKEIKDDPFTREGKLDTDRLNAGEMLDDFIANFPIFTEEQKRRTRERFPKAYKTYKEVRNTIQLLIKYISSEIL